MFCVQNMDVLKILSILFPGHHISNFNLLQKKKINGKNINVDILISTFPRQYWVKDVIL